MAAITPITPLPAAPSRADGPVIFNQRADPFIAALPPFVLQANTLAQAVSVASQAAVDAAATATQQAAIASGAGGAAAAEVAKAKTFADNAKASATAAESAPGSIGNLALLHALTIAMM